MASTYGLDARLAKLPATAKTELVPIDPLAIGAPIGAQLLACLKRYRAETPLGHQPHMLAAQADQVIAAAEVADCGAGAGVAGWTSQKMIDVLREPSTICATIWPKAAAGVDIALYTHPPAASLALSAGALDVLAERRRQVDGEGWASWHDDRHTEQQLPRAAVCYILGNGGGWPWASPWWKPGTMRRNLVKAAALIIAEIERLDRAEEKRATR